MGFQAHRVSYIPGLGPIFKHHHIWTWLSTTHPHAHCRYAYTYPRVHSERPAFTTLVIPRKSSAYHPLCIHSFVCGRSTLSAPSHCDNRPFRELVVVVVVVVVVQYPRHCLHCHFLTTASSLTVQGFVRGRYLINLDSFRLIVHLQTKD